MRGSLPHTIESTWYITEAILNDGTSGQATTISALALRSIYCTAFCRFVTGLLDTTQESYYKVSMYDKARELNLPTSFVELRHEAIHGELPSLVVLRQAAQKALNWLQTNYWNQLSDQCSWVDADPSCPGESNTSMRENLRNMVLQYPAHASPKRDRDNSTASRIMFRSIMKILEDSNGGKRASAVFIDVLLNHWMTYTSSDDSFTAIPNLNDIYNSWDPVLKLLALERPLFLRMLSEVMTKHLISQPTLASSKEAFQAAIFTGLNQIYTASDWHKAYEQSGLNGLELVSKCLQSPSRWTTQLAASISECRQHVQIRRAFGDRISQTMKSLEFRDAAATEPPNNVSEKLDPVSIRDRRLAE